MSPTEHLNKERTFWDPETQQPHAGQDWKLCGDRFIEDFSVTTNGLGTPVKALEAAADAVRERGEVMVLKDGI